MKIPRKTFFYIGGVIGVVLVMVCRLAAAEGALDGVFETRRSDGRLESRAAYRGGVLEGEYEQFAEDGTTLAEVRTYRADKLNGPSRRYYPDGTIAEEVNYLDGMLDGIHRQYDSSGRRVTEAVYKRGKPVGPHRVYDSHGNLISEIRYEAGVKTTVSPSSRPKPKDIQ